MKLVLDVDLKGLINYSPDEMVLMKSGDADDIEAMHKIIEAGDTIDADQGATDGDIDAVVKKRILFTEERVMITLKLEPEEGDPTSP